jgi:hypothetical protein
VIRLKQFGIQRYALPLDLLAGLMLFLSLDRLLRSQREVAFVFGFLARCGFVDRGRIPCTKKWFGVACCNTRRAQSCT